MSPFKFFLLDARDPYFDARNFDAKSFDARNWMKLNPGRWDMRDPYFRPTSHPDLQSRTSRHHHHNNLRNSGSTISKNV